jgi:hypothetical protein
MGKSETDTDQHFIGIIECPLRKGFIEFQFSASDPVSDLKMLVEQTWGAPRSGLDKHRDPLIRDFVYDVRIWAIYCQAKDGSYIQLHDDDLIPTSSPQGGGREFSNLGYTDSVTQSNMAEAEPGLVHIKDLKPNIGVNLFFDHQREAREDRPYNVRLVALVVIAGG